MTKFVFIYRGGLPGATKEEQDKIMADWGKWFTSMGDTLIDMGNPFGQSKAVRADGVSGEVDGHPATGYSIIHANNHGAAAELAKGCPLLSYSPGGSVEVYEALPM